MFSPSFVPTSAGNGFTEGEHKERRKRECRGPTAEQTLRQIFYQRNSSRQCVTMNTSCLQHSLLSSPQRPYVMRSSTPANEILQIFHKVHPSYPAAWSLEMKSLLRKVNESHMLHAQNTVGFISPFHMTLNRFTSTRLQNKPPGVRSRNRQRSVRFCGLCSTRKN